jgi:hypothetical protein
LTNYLTNIDNKKILKKYHYSLIVLVFAECFLFFTNINNFYFELFFKIYIYISIFFLLFSFDKQEFTNFNLLEFLSIFALFILGIFQAIREPVENFNLITSNYYYSAFGNPLFIPSFFVFLFIFWGHYRNGLYWFEKTSLLSIKVGILLVPISYFFNLDYCYILFLPTFYLLAGYQYSNRKRKNIILLGIFLGAFVFFLENYRSGIIRILISTLVFMVIYFNLIALKNILKIVFIITPFYFFYDTLNNFPNNLMLISDYLNSYFDTSITTDTRTFIYKETFDYLKSSSNLLVGDGPLGNYYSPYFDYLRYSDQFTEGDFYIRATAEVGIIQMLLKGGFVNLFLISFIIINLSLKSFNSNNKYVQNLSLIALSYFAYMSIENIPSFNFLNASFWILLGISSSKKIIDYSDKDMYNLFSSPHNNKD